MDVAAVITDNLYRAMQHEAGYEPALTEDSQAQGTIIFEAGGVGRAAVMGCFHKAQEFSAVADQAEFKAINLTGIGFLFLCVVKVRLTVLSFVDCLHYYVF